MNSNIEKLQETIKRAKSCIFGQDELLESILCALVCEGHLLIEGMPGLGKTMSVNTMARLCDLSFKRIQFTPDLLPSDLIGTMIYSQKTEQFHTQFGPIFTQLLLADEINRSPAKVQSALLEAMAERQVTIGDETHPLTSPFVVMATQNPIEQEGTYQLPEAQLDRFMMKVNVSYPESDAEKLIVTNSLKKVKLEPIISTDDIIKIQKMSDEIYVDQKIVDYIVRVVNGTRPSSKEFAKDYKGAIFAGVSPRAGIWLYKIGKYYALLDGKDFVSPDNILKAIPSVFGHRIILTYEAIIDKMNSQEIALKIAKKLI